MKSIFQVVYVTSWAGKEAIVKENSEWDEYVVECFDRASMVAFYQFYSIAAAKECAQAFTIRG